MSLYGALRSGVSSLFANSQRMAMISDNIANVNTVGYKRVDARFSSFVTQSSRQGLYNSGGVVSLTERENAQQGILEPTAFSTDIAVTGAGFFVVTDDVTRTDSGAYENSGVTSYTRAGQFRRDSNGNLVNAEGQYLLSWSPEEGVGSRSEDLRFVQTNDISRFEVVNIEQQALDPIETSRVDLGVNLAAEAGIGINNAFSVEVPVVDPQGISRSLTLTFVRPTATAADTTPTLPNEWILYGSFGVDASVPNFADVAATGATAVVINTPTTGEGRVALGRVTFDANGRLAGVNDNIPVNTYFVDGEDVTLQGLVPTAIGNRILTTVDNTFAEGGIQAAGQTGRFFLNIDYTPGTPPNVIDPTRQVMINLGTVASQSAGAGSDGFTQFGTGNDLSLIKFIEQNGRLFSGIDSVAISSGGIIEGSYSNGETRALYQVPLFTFPNPNGLRSRSGNLFAATADAGTGVARVSGTQGAGTIVGSAVENSTTDIATEFSNMIITQRAFSAATRIVTTTDEMLQELSNAIR